MLLTSSCYKGKKGFTLAEVLLVLVIIGVIAALTIPNLTASSDLAANIAGTKKAHSTLNQALEKTKATFGHYPRCYYWNGNNPNTDVTVECRYEGSNECTYYTVNKVTGEEKKGVPANWNGNYADCEEFFKEFFKNLNIQKECTKGALADGCIDSNLKGIDGVRVDSGASEDDTQKATSGCGGYRTAAIRTNTYTKVLGDGMVIIPYSITSAPIILVDVNGKRGPNKMGYDLSMFQLKGDNEDSAWYPGGCEVVAKGGLSTQSKLLHK